LSTYFSQEIYFTDISQVVGTKNGFKLNRRLHLATANVSSLSIDISYHIPPSATHLPEK